MADVDKPDGSMEVSEDEAELFPDGECAACEQKFQEKDEDFLSNSTGFI